MVWNPTSCKGSRSGEFMRAKVKGMDKVCTRSVTCQHTTGKNEGGQLLGDDFSLTTAAADEFNQAWDRCLDLFRNTIITN